MALPAYIVLNEADEIISTHRCMPSSKKPKYEHLKERSVSLGNYSLDGVKLPKTLKKGVVVKGLWKQLRNEDIKSTLTDLMAKYINNRVVDSDEPYFRLREKGLVSKSYLMDCLADQKLDFDDWIEQYRKPGQELALLQEAELLEDAERKALCAANLEKSKEHFSGACFSLPAIAGKMGNDIYYTVQIPFGQVAQLFSFNEESVPVELRAQRVLNEKRARAIADYILERRGDFTIPAITASVDQYMAFESVEGFSNLGAVKIPIGSTLLINDGQHRRRGIEIALKECPDLKEHSLTAVLFYDQGLEKSQQIFADINDKMVKPSKALSVLFDKRNALNSIVLYAIDKAEIRNAIEFEKSSPGANSRKLWSVMAIKKALELLTGLNSKKAEELNSEQIDNYTDMFGSWLSSFVNNSPGGLERLVTKGLAADVSEARTELVNTHAVFLHSVALASRELCGAFNSYISGELKELLANGCPIPDFSELECLLDLDIEKTSLIWRDRIVRTDGTMNPTVNGVKLGAYVILELMGVSIPDNIQEVNSMVFPDTK